jgi:hypothetical protein
VEREGGKAKFWLKPVRLDNSSRFGRAEIGRIQKNGRGKRCGAVKVMA